MLQYLLSYQSLSLDLMSLAAIPFFWLFYRKTYFHRCPSVCTVSTHSNSLLFPNKHQLVFEFPHSTASTPVKVADTLTTTTLQTQVTPIELIMLFFKCFVKRTVNSLTNCPVGIPGSRILCPFRDFPRSSSSFLMH